MVTISNEQKIYELSQIWKDAEYNFAFWDKVNIDWDAEYKKALPGVLATTDVYEYYRELERFINLLGDGHTGVSFPPDIMQNTEYYSMIEITLSDFMDGRDKAMETAVSILKEQFGNHFSCATLI